MASRSVVVDVARLWAPENLKRSAPGILLGCAIAALGIKTSLLAMVRIGMRPVMLLVIETVFIGLLVAGLIYGLRGVVA